MYERARAADNAGQCSGRWLRRRDRLADQLPVQELLAFLAADGDDLVALAQDRVRPERRRQAVADDREQRAAVRDVEVLGRLADRRTRQMLER